MPPRDFIPTKRQTRADVEKDRTWEGEISENNKAEYPIIVNKHASDILQEANDYVLPTFTPRRHESDLPPTEALTPLQPIDHTPSQLSHRRTRVKGPRKFVRHSLPNVQRSGLSSPFLATLSDAVSERSGVATESRDFDVKPGATVTAGSYSTKHEDTTDSPYADDEKSLRLPETEAQYRPNFNLGMWDSGSEKRLRDDTGSDYKPEVCDNVYLRKPVKRHSFPVTPLATTESLEGRLAHFDSSAEIAEHDLSELPPISLGNARYAYAPSATDQLASLTSSTSSSSSFASHTGVLRRDTNGSISSRSSTSSASSIYSQIATQPFPKLGRTPCLPPPIKENRCVGDINNQPDNDPDMAMGEDVADEAQIILEPAELQGVFGDSALREEITEEFIVTRRKPGAPYCPAPVYIITGAYTDSTEVDALDNIDYEEDFYTFLDEPPVFDQGDASHDLALVRPDEPLPGRLPYLLEHSPDNLARKPNRTIFDRLLQPSLFSNIFVLYVFIIYLAA